MPNPLEKYYNATPTGTIQSDNPLEQYKSPISPEIDSDNPLDKYKSVAASAPSFIAKVLNFTFGEGMGTGEFSKMTTFGQALDLMGRPGYAVKSLINQSQEEMKQYLRDNGIPEEELTNPLNLKAQQLALKYKPRIAERFKALWRGFTGHERTTFGQLWQNAGLPHIPFAQFIINMAGEIGTDPMMWAGGAGYKAITAGTKVITKPLAIAGKAGVELARKIPKVAQAIDFAVDTTGEVKTWVYNSFITKSKIPELAEKVDQYLSKRQWLSGKGISFGVQTRDAIQKIMKESGKSADDIERMIVNVIEDPKKYMKLASPAELKVAKAVSNRLGQTFTTMTDAGVPISSLGAARRQRIGELYTQLETAVGTEKTSLLGQISRQQDALQDEIIKFRGELRPLEVDVAHYSENPNITAWKVNKKTIKNDLGADFGSESAALAKQKDIAKGGVGGKVYYTKMAPKRSIDMTGIPMEEQLQYWDNPDDVLKFLSKKEGILGPDEIEKLKNTIPDPQDIKFKQPPKIPTGKEPVMQRVWDRYNKTYLGGEGYQLHIFEKPPTLGSLSQDAFDDMMNRLWVKIPENKLAELYGKTSKTYAMYKGKLAPFNRTLIDLDEAGGYLDTEGKLIKLVEKDRSGVNIIKNTPKELVDKVRQQQGGLIDSIHFHEMGDSIPSIADLKEFTRTKHRNLYIIDSQGSEVSHITLKTAKTHNKVLKYMRDTEMTDREFADIRETIGEGRPAMIQYMNDVGFNIEIHPIPNIRQEPGYLTMTARPVFKQTGKTTTKLIASPTGEEGLIQHLRTFMRRELTAEEMELLPKAVQGSVDIGDLRIRYNPTNNKYDILKVTAIAPTEEAGKFLADKFYDAQQDWYVGLRQKLINKGYDSVKYFSLDDPTTPTYKALTGRIVGPATKASVRNQEKLATMITAKEADVVNLVNEAKEIYKLPVSEKRIAATARKLGVGKVEARELAKLQRAREMGYFPRITSKEAEGFLKNASKNPGMGARIWNPKIKNALRRTTSDFTLDEWNVFVKENGIEAMSWNKVEEYFMRDPAYAVALYEVRAAKAITSAEFIQDVTKTFGKTAKEALPKFEELPAAIQKLYPASKGLKFDPEILKEITRVTEHYINPSTTYPALRILDNIQNSWRKWTLAPFPKYHLRNMVGNLWNNYLADVDIENYPKAQALQLYRKYRTSVKFKDYIIQNQDDLTRVGQQIAEKMGITVPIKFRLNDPDMLAYYGDPNKYGAWAIAMDRLDVEGKYAIDIFTTNKTKPQWISDTIIHELQHMQDKYLKSAISHPKSFYEELKIITNRMYDVNISAYRQKLGEKVALAELERFRISPEIADTIIASAEESGVLGRGWYGADVELAIRQQMGKGGLIQRGLAAGTTIENNARLAHYLDKLDKGADSIEAALSVKKYLFDYGDITSFERDVMKRLFPFYIWSRKNIPLQLQELYKNPQKFAPLAIPFRLRNEEDIIKLKYARPDLYERLPIELSRTMDTVTYVPLEGLIPAGDLAKMGRPHELLFELLTPYIRAPLELYMNKSMYFGTEIEQYPGETQQLWRMDIPVKLKYLLTTVLPQARLISEIDKIVKKQTNKEELTPAEQAFSQSLSSIYKVNLNDLKQRALSNLKKKAEELRKGAAIAGRQGRPTEIQNIKRIYYEKLREEIKRIQGD